MSTEREIIWTIRYLSADNSDLKEQVNAVIERLERLLAEIKD